MQALSSLRRLLSVVNFRRVPCGVHLHLLKAYVDREVFSANRAVEYLKVDMLVVSNAIFCDLVRLAEYAPLNICYRS